MLNGEKYNDDNDNIALELQEICTIIFQKKGARLKENEKLSVSKVQLN